MQNKEISPFADFKQHWLLWIALLLWLGCLLLIIAHITYSLGTIFYWAFIFYNYDYPLFEIGILFCAGLCCFLLWYRQRPRELSRQRRIGSLVMLILALAMLVNITALRIYIHTIIDTPYVHKASFFTGQSYLHLALNTGYYPGGALNLYQCDANGQMCQLLQKNLCPVDPGASVSEDARVDVPISMRTNDSGQQLTITISNLFTGYSETCTIQLQT